MMQERERGGQQLDDQGEPVGEVVAGAAVESNAAIAASRVGSREQVGGFHCDGHHEMSDLGGVGEPVHRGGESIEPMWPHTSDRCWLG